MEPPWRSAIAQFPVVSSLKRAVGAAARTVGVGSSFPDKAATHPSNSRSSEGSGSSKSMLDSSLNALLKSHSPDNSSSNKLDSTGSKSSAFPLLQAVNLSEDKRVRAAHPNRRSRDLKHERQFGLRPSLAAEPGPSSKRDDLYGERSRPRKMRAYTSPSSGQSKRKANGNPITTARTGKSSSSQRRFGWKFYILLLLALVILGTFTVLRTAVHFFGIHERDVVSIEEVLAYAHVEALPYNAELSPSQAREEEEQLGLKRERIPRIIHQTWKNNDLPEKWETARRECMAMLPGFEFKLWTDADSREFIATEYPSFLPTWDSYRERF